MVAGSKLSRKRKELSGDLWFCKFQEAGIRAFEGICDKYLNTDSGRLSLGGICLVAGLGPEKDLRRDGTFDYYMSEPIVQDDAKGVGPFLLAYNEYKQIKK